MPDNAPSLARIRVVCRSAEPMPTGADVDLRAVLSDGTEVRLPAVSLCFEADVGDVPVRLTLVLHRTDVEFDLPAEVVRIIEAARSKT